MLFLQIGVIVVGSFIALLNQTVMSPALPALMHDFNITTGTVQWVTSVYMLFSTFKTSAEAIAYPPSLFPKEWQWENYAKAWDAQPFGKYLLNSVIVTVLNTLGTVLSCSLVAYGFARYNFKGKNILFMILLSTMMIPWDVTMIPQ